MNESAQESARAMFPLMPDEVFTAWIGEIVEVNGWPFPTVECPYPHLIWSNFFLGLPLAYWADAVWTQSTFEDSGGRLAPDSATRVMNVATHAMNGIPAFIGVQVANSAARVHAHRAFIERERRFPGFITALDDSRGHLHLVDGHHRLAALWSSGITMEVPVWKAML